uniref:Integrase catalytic domain-containing protein n=1 Tax=Micrurus carvalhoi TaxID=3147026 RepID=A0A2H6ND44_9SAUR
MMLKQAGIEHKRSAPYTPQHNAFVERRGQMLQAMAHTMLSDSGLPDTLWGEAMCPNHVLNNVVNTTTGELPFARWNGRKPNLSYLHTFGAPAWVHIPSQVRRKGQHRARELVFVGMKLTIDCLDSGMKAQQIFTVVLMLNFLSMLVVIRARIQQ